MAQGFTVLAWVNEDSSLLQNVSEEAAVRIRKQLLQDFCCLLSVRWTFDVTLVEHDGVKYAYGCNTRITASYNTIKNAIGDLSNHVEFLRGHANASYEQLADYKLCRMKWKVPDNVTEDRTSYGWGDSERAETSQPYKRKRF